MSQASGQHAERLRFCGFTPLLFTLDAFRDLNGKADDVFQAARLVSHWKSQVPDPGDRSVGPDDAVLFLALNAAERTVAKRGHAISITGVNRIQKRACILQESVASAPPDHLASGADVHETFRLRIPDPQDFTDILGNAPEHFFASSEIGLAPLPINELADLTSEDGEQFQQLLVLAPDRAAEELHYAENFPAC